MNDETLGILAFLNMALWLIVFIVSMPTSTVLLVDALLLKGLLTESGLYGVILGVVALYSWFQIILSDAAEKRFS